MQFPIKDIRFQWLLLSMLVVIGLEVLSLLGIHMPFEILWTSLLILSTGRSVLQKGFIALYKGKWSSINLLMSIAVIAAYYLKEYTEAAVVIVLYVMGEKLEDIGIENSKTSLDTLLKKAPKKAYVLALEEYVLIDEVAVGSIVGVKPGEYIPLDGVIVKGHSSVDESAITGEPLPKDKHLGDTVYAATLNREGYIELRSSKRSEDTTFSKIIKLSFEATAHKSETQKFIQKFSSYYTPAVIMLSTLVFVIPVFFMGHAIQHSLEQAIALLVIACPCALLISTPVAIYAAIGNASAKGVCIKGGKYIEALAQIKAIGLDKTRTLTQGKPVVSDLLPMSPFSKADLLSCTAGAEMFSEHPLAQAIVDACKHEGVEIHEVRNYKSNIGKGATAQCMVCANREILIGKLDYIQEHLQLSSETLKQVDQLSAQGKTCVLVSYGHELAGIIGLSDALKPDALSSIKALQNLGIEPVLLSGDRQETVAFAAKSLGITQFVGNLLPEDKAAQIGILQTKFQYVGMLGDGINDAPALACSNVGIAMAAEGSDTAIETANMALLNDRLSLLPYLIQLSRHTLRTIRFNTLSAIAIKLFFILLAFWGYSHLVFAIAADLGVTLFVILNSLRIMNLEEQSNENFPKFATS